MQSFLLPFLLVVIVLVVGNTVSSQPTSSSTGNNGLPVCGPPSSIQLLWTDEHGNPLPLNTPTSALHSAHLNITNLLSTTNVVNLTLNAIPLSSISEMGLLLLAIGDSNNYNISSHNSDEFSIEVFEASYNLYQPGISVPLDEEYGFNNTLNSIYAANAIFFTNGNSENSAYLGTVSIQSSPAPGVECETTFYYLVLFNPINNITNSSVMGDPRFISLRNEEFQVHGFDGSILCIWSNPNVLVNTRFGYLDEHTPQRLKHVISHHQNKTIFSRTHNGTFLTQLGIRTSFGDLIFIEAGTDEEGFRKVIVNNQILSFSTSNHVSITLDSLTAELDYIRSDYIKIHVNKEFTMLIENADEFLNIVSLVTHTTKGSGLLGATHRRHNFDTPLRVVPGIIDDYLIPDNDIFGDDFVFNRFKPIEPVKGSVSE